MRGSAVLLAIALGIAFPPAAWAQSAPQVQAEVDESVVGMGDTVHLQLTATSSDAMPGDPRPGATPGFVVRAQNASPSQTHLDINGSQSDQYSLTVDWLLQAQRVGTYSVGPPSVAIHGARYSSHAVTLRVVPAGKAPLRKPRPQPSQSPFGFSPFDPWRGLFPDVSGNAPEPAAPAVTTDPKLSLEAPRDPIYFLRATVDKTVAVVGEQVTFGVYEYVDTSVGGIEGDEDHDPQVADFVKHSLLRDDQDPPVVGYASVGGRLWRVRLVRRWALFPLHAGDLTIGPMSVNITLARQRGGGGARRTTDPLHVRVSDPPLARRPPGYALGDVGHFSLKAQIDPRDVSQGGAIAVHVELSGTGNIPSAVTPPALEGVEWLSPEVHDDLGTVGQATYGGKRTLDFVVRFRRAGDVDLGAISLPFWDPDQKRYDVARASLGVVHVSPSSSPDLQPAASATELLSGLPVLRDALERTPVARAHWDDSPVFWFAAVAGWPLVFGVAVAASLATRRVGSAWRGRRTSPAAELRGRVAAARAACRGHDARTADAATARALEAASVASAGVSIRGAVGDEIVQRLEGAGVDRQAASRVAELLRECDAARFAPEAADVARARERWDRAERAITHLGRGA
jgi:hypothetical protein